MHTLCHRSVVTFALGGILGCPAVLLGQEHVAVLLTGTYRTTYEQKFGSSPFGDMNVKSIGSPGVEIVASPSGWVSVGVGFKRLQFDPKSDLVISLRDEFSYFAPDGSLQTVIMPGTVFAEYDVRSEGSIKALVSNVYVNFVQEGPVRPFVGIGGAVGFAERSFEYKTFVHPLLSELQGFAYELRDFTDRKPVGILSVKGGINVYFKHLAFRAGGGYENGGMAEVGVGLVF